VLVGHQKQELPIGRVFKGEVVQKQGRRGCAPISTGIATRRTRTR
jgi:hypothetical protein